MKSRFIWGAGMALAACVSAGAASAHHSFAMFDGTKKITIAGTVREFQWTNPHVWLEVLVEKGGKAQNWSLEGSSVNMLARAGWRAKTVKPGDKVTIEIHPRRDGGFGGALLNVTLPDGRKMDTGGNPTAATKKAN